jgi:hypothetical protein
LKSTHKTIVSTIILPKPRRWIACLFTSIGYGKPNMKINNPGKGAPSSILSFTRAALEELRTRLEDFGPSNFDKMTRRTTDDEKPGEIWSPKFNSGAFGVDWEDTEQILIKEFQTFERPWYLVNKIKSNDYEPQLENEGSEVQSDGRRGGSRGGTPSHSKGGGRGRKRSPEPVDNDHPLRDFLIEQGFYH